jgi:hypothetical protein
MRCCRAGRDVPGGGAGGKHDEPPELNPKGPDTRVGPRAWHHHDTGNRGARNDHTSCDDARHHDACERRPTGHGSADHHGSCERRTSGSHHAGLDHADSDGPADCHPDPPARRRLDHRGGRSPQGQSE